MINRSKERDPTLYIDTGCQHSPKCLTCPLPACVHDLLHQGVSLEQAQRDTERANAVAAASETMPRNKAIAKVAKDYGITKRTMWRILGRTN